MEKLNLRQIRLAKEISIDQIAEYLGIHPNTYSLWEKEAGKISMENAVKICGFLGVNFDADIFLVNE